MQSQGNCAIKIAKEEEKCNKKFLINKNSPQNKSSSVSAASANAKAQSELAAGKASAKDRRAQFQASRRIMSAPIRPLNQFEDAKNKRKPARKKKVIRYV